MDFATCFNNSIFIAKETLIMHIAFSCCHFSLVFFNQVQFLSLSLYLTLITLKNTGQLFCSVSLNLRLFDFTSWLDLAYSFPQNTADRVCYPWWLGLGVHDVTCDVNLRAWLIRWCLLAFSVIKVLFLPFVIMRSYLETM